MTGAPPGVTAAGAEALAVIAAGDIVVALDAPTAVAVPSAEVSAKGDKEGNSIEAAGACRSTVKELPIETSTATPGADSLVSPAVLAKTAAPCIGSVAAAATT